MHFKLPTTASARFNAHLLELFADVDADSAVPNAAPLCTRASAALADDSSRSNDDAEPLELLASVTYSEPTLARMRGGNAFFDSRLFAVPRVELVRQNILWRQQHDCR